MRNVSEKCERELAAIDEEIHALESQIVSNAKEFESVRADMLLGIVSYEGIQAQDRSHRIMERLEDLRKDRTAALARVDKYIFENLSDAERRRQGEAEEKKRADRRANGYCEGGCTELINDRHRAVDYCTVCGAVYDHRVDNTPEFFAYEDVHPGESVPRRRGGGYKPPNHFAEIIAQFQGKRRSAAPQDVVDMVGEYCRRYDIPRHKITPKVVRMFLKQRQQEEAAVLKFSKKRPTRLAEVLKSALPPTQQSEQAPQAKKRKSDDDPESHPPRKYTDYYKHTPEIAWRLSGIPPPYLTPMQEDRVVALFPMVVDAYKTSPRYLTRKANRTNRIKENPNNLNYLYVFYKECQLLGYDEFLPYIPLPKSVANIDDCDSRGWKHICEVYGWAYTPTR